VIEQVVPRRDIREHLLDIRALAFTARRARCHTVRVEHGRRRVIGRLDYWWGCGGRHRRNIDARE
jgi:hypothetical protein